MELKSYLKKLLSSTWEEKNSDFLSIIEIKLNTLVIKTK